MNLNPFVFHYKVYDQCPIATMISGMLSGTQRILIILSIMLYFICIFDPPTNLVEALIGATVLLIFWFLIKRYKIRWTNYIAEKEFKKNSL